jgi:hypothetical protein
VNGVPAVRQGVAALVGGATTLAAAALAGGRAAAVVAVCVVAVLAIAARTGQRRARRTARRAGGAGGVSASTELNRRAAGGPRRSARWRRAGAPPSWRACWPACWPAVEHLAGRLEWASRSPRGFAYGARPVLLEVLRVLLADRGLDARRDADLVRVLVGEEAYRLLDPVRDGLPAGELPAVSPGAPQRVVRRLEDLAEGLSEGWPG